MLKRITFMAVSMVAAMFVAGAPAVYAADGSLRMAIDLSRSNTRIDLDKSGDTLTGSFFGFGRPQASLKKTEGSGWQGWYGEQYISSTSVKDLGNGKFAVQIKALPAGIFDFNYVVKQDGKVEMNATGPRGNLNNASLSKDGKSFSFGNMVMSYGVSRNADGSYSGSASVNGATFDSGYVTVRATGVLALPEVAKDPELFALVYAFPFVR